MILNRLFKNIFKNKTKMNKTKQKKARTIKVQSQHKVKGTKKESDRKRKALKPGIRVSKNGNVYTERRSNRSDTNPRKGV